MSGRQGKIENLPKWAQEHIVRLERTVSSAQQTLVSLCEGTVPGPIKIGRIATWSTSDGNAEKPYYLPGDDVLVEHGGVKAQLVCAETNGVEELRVYLEPVHHKYVSRVVVVPVASNTFNLEPLPRASHTLAEAKTGSN